MEERTGTSDALEALLILIGNVKKIELSFLPNELSKIFRFIRFKISEKSLKLPSYAYNEARKQYNSTLLLEYLTLAKPRGYVKYLGIADVDLYAKSLNFVFGEAILNGEEAIISLYRLRPEFYGEAPDQSVFEDRIIKEATHELGHTFGLIHCDDPKCVMHFSNSIIDTDFKGPQPCADCSIKLFQKLFVLK